LLNEYIGNGQPWDLDRAFGGVQILPPYQAKKGGAWYRGTANAVWQNKQFIERYAPKYVLVLSADHIYRMNYRTLLQQHIDKRADATVAVIEVPLAEASRFGILSADRNGFMTDFEEKPAKPKSNLASMGIYVFNTEYLLDYLEKDDGDSASQNDFGKNVIPAMLRDGGRLGVYRFGGYWKDVGTLESLWQANMDLIGEEPEFDLFRSGKRIFSAAEAVAPQFIGAQASVSESILSQGCRIMGRVEHSVLSPGVVVEQGAVVKDCVLMRDAHIGRDAVVEYAILDESVQIAPGSCVGESKEGGRLTVIGREAGV
jgi:glucose-1-phosphate adenylyltransferase